MTQERLEACKADLLESYKEDLCEESIEAIQQASTPEQLVRILHQFATFLAYKAIPKAEWARKWFSDETELLNSCGVYLDQKVILVDPEERSLVAIGNTHLSLSLTKAHIWNISLQDESDMVLSTYGVNSAVVREKGTGKTTVLFQSSESKIKIHTI